MLYNVPNGFISRADAQRLYQRSKSSFIRDVDDALQRDDREFLKNFCVLLNDGREIAGTDATKDAVQAVQSKQPRWYVSIELLETRYWATDSPPPDESADAVERPERPAESAVESSDSATLRHQLDLAQQRIANQSDTIDALNRDKAFLQDELTNRRGEIEKLQGLFQSVGGVADSAAKLRAASADHDTVAETVDGPVPYRGMPPSQTWMKRYLPTLHETVSRFRRP